MQGKIGCSPEVFARARAAAEQAVWRRDGGLDSHAGPTEFYHEVARRLHLAETDVPDLVAAELALEADALRAVPAAHRLLQRCEALGIPVSFTSDTYFSGAFIGDKLRSLELMRPGSRLLISSEEARSKASGRLFGGLTDADLSPGDILHVGDHPHSDVAAPGRLGIETRWCVAARLNRYEEMLGEAAPPTAGLAASFAGASRMARVSVAAQDRREAAIRDVAAGVAAPALVGYVLWILKRAQELSLERLVFLARDGQVLCELAQRIARSLGLKIDVRYIYVSRRSTNLAATFEADEEEIGWVFRDVTQLTPAGFLGRFDLQWSDVADLLAMPGGEPGSAADIAPAFRAGLADGPIRDAVLARAAARREVVLDYLRQEGLLDEAPQAIVDFGGVGSQIRAIHALVQNAGATPPHIFMIGLDKPEDAGLTTPAVEPAWVAATEAYLYDHRRNRGIRRLRGFGTCVQMFCAADHGTVTGYRREDGAVAPDLAARVDQEMLDWGLGLFRSSLASFVDHLVLDVDLVDPFADVRDISCALINEFWTNPDADEAMAWGSYPFEGAQASGGAPQPLAHRYTLSTIGRDLRAGRFPNLGWQHWYEGSLAMSAAPIRGALRQAEALYRRSEGGSGFLQTRVVAGIRWLAGR